MYYWYDTQCTSKDHIHHGGISCQVTKHKLTFDFYALFSNQETEKWKTKGKIFTNTFSKPKSLLEAVSQQKT